MKKASYILLKICEVASLLVSICAFIVALYLIICGGSINIKDHYQEEIYKSLPFVGLSFIGWVLSFAAIFYLINFIILKVTTNNLTKNNFVTALVFGIICQSIPQIVGSILGLCIKEENMMKRTEEIIK